jgi:dynein heavy chain
MAYVHLSIGEANKDFLSSERRHNYTTPTSFLELINFYKLLLSREQGKIGNQINRLENGLGIMQSVTEKVDDLKSMLELKMKDVEVEKSKTDELIEIVGKETEIAEAESAAAAI